MQQFPIFVSVHDRSIVLSGGGETALAKLRLLLKTSANITVYDAQPEPAVLDLADQGKITLIHRTFKPGDAKGATLFYAANDDEIDLLHAQWARNDGALANVVDNPQASDFFTPAIVDRDPVTIAIGTEGAAPVLARKIKADLEERLAPTLGRLTRIAQGFRAAADALPKARHDAPFGLSISIPAAPKRSRTGRTLRGSRWMTCCQNTLITRPAKVTLPLSARVRVTPSF